MLSTRYIVAAGDHKNTKWHLHGEALVTEHCSTKPRRERKTLYPAHIKKRGSSATAICMRGDKTNCAACPIEFYNYLLNRSDIPLEACELLPRQALVLSTSARVDLTHYYAHGADSQEVTQLELVRLRSTVSVGPLMKARLNRRAQIWVAYGTSANQVLLLYLILYSNINSTSQIRSVKYSVYTRGGGTI